MGEEPSKPLTEAEAFEVMGLGPAAALWETKSAYKSLSRLFHTGKC